MQIALVDGSRRAAIPRHLGQCPACFASVRSACGSIVAWHWKHVAGTDCDPWSEPESDWHRWWKGLFPEDCREVVIGPHRADVATSDEIIELQHSPITGDEIAEREAFYGERLIWVFDLGGFRDEVWLHGSSDGYNFMFKHPKKAIASCRRRVFIDCGGGVVLEPKVWHGAKQGFGIVHDVDWLRPPAPLKGKRHDVAPVAPVWTEFNPYSRTWTSFGWFEQFADSGNCRSCYKPTGKHLGRFSCCPIDRGSLDDPMFLHRCKKCQRLERDHEDVKYEDGKWFYRSR